MPTLRAVNGAPIWGAGDCVDAGGPSADTPKAGVYAVRQGPVLARNLRARWRRGRRAKYVPQRTFLSLLNTADGKALLRWHGLVSHSRFAWRLKDRIDRRFVGPLPRPRLSGSPPISTRLPSCAFPARALAVDERFRATLTERGRRAMGRRALFWSGAVLVGLIVQQAAVQLVRRRRQPLARGGPLVVLLLSVPALLLGSRVEGMSRWRRWREARRRAVKHHRS